MPLPTDQTNRVFRLIVADYLYETAKNMVVSLLPGSRFSQEQGVVISIKSQITSEGICTKVAIGDTAWSHVDWEILASRYSPEHQLGREKEWVRLGLLRLLQQVYDLPPRPWGTLTGVRPTKLVHQLRDAGYQTDEIRDSLINRFGVASERVKLLLAIEEKQRPFFNPNPNQPVSLYVGIPFCPTRCGYCSFAAYPLKTHGHLLKGFYQALVQEILELGDFLNSQGIIVETVYLGGGTPTTITGGDLARLLNLIASSFCQSNWQEFTVEAGRPETLTCETIEILANAKVDRVSINPQTMRDDTLQRIGRAHSAKDVEEAFYRCRRMQIPTINMDIILGLPGETLADVEYTLAQIGRLGPDNLTVHSLARKRASKWNNQYDKMAVAQNQGQAMVELAGSVAKEWQMEAYYLYRQRSILSDLENIGYAHPGTESIYNIQVMEERQTIIGVGGGAITKLVKPDLSLTRIANPKCPATYQQQINKLLTAKKSQLCQHFAV